MSIFDTSVADHAKEIDKRKEFISQCCAETLQEMKKRHEFIFSLVWNQPDVTPQEVMDAYGQEAVQLFVLSKAIQDMLAGTGMGYAPITPPNEFAINPDGTVTVGAKIEAPAS